MAIEGFQGFFAGGFDGADVDARGALGELVVIASGEVVTVGGDPDGEGSGDSGKF